MPSRTYSQARDWAAKACSIVREEGYSFPFDLCFKRVLGGAQFRCGQFPEALTTLTRSNGPGGTLPADLAFLAMTYARLGEAKTGARTYQPGSNNSRGTESRWGTKTEPFCVKPRQ